MKYWLPTLLLLAFWASIAFLFVMPEAPGSSGVAHDQFKEMSKSVVNHDQEERILAVGSLYGAAVIIAFVGLLAWPVFQRTGTDGEAGLLKGDRKRLLMIFLTGLVLYELVFAALCLVYSKSLSDPFDSAFIGPFPAATALLLFGLWPFPVFFIHFYVVNFDRWIYGRHDSRRMEQLVDQRAAAKSKVNYSADREK